MSATVFPPVGSEPNRFSSPVTGPSTEAAGRLMTETAQCDLCGTAEHASPLATGWDFEYATCHQEFRIVRCSACGLVYLADRPVAEALPVIYPTNYYSFDESARENRVVKAVRDQLERRKAAVYTRLLGPGSRNVLDVGCGDGRLLDILKAHADAGWRLTGVEIGAGAAARAEAKGYEVVHGNFETVNLTAWRGRFDLVLMHQVLEHTRSPRHAIRKVLSLLKPGGIFSIETPDTKSWDGTLFGRRYWGGYHIPRHFYLFNKENLSRLLAQEGFEVIWQRSILSPVFWIHSLHNALVDHPRTARLGRFAHYQSSLLLAAATMIDLVQITVASRSSNMQVLARRRDAPA
jgi:SAM-dependent methyltransferase